jgi:magnesium-transporting ATPase (P-type)
MSIFDDAVHLPFIYGNLAVYLFFFLSSLSVGDRVPADVRLVKVNELSADESSFTGEPCAQLKQIATVKGHGHEKLNISDMTNVAFQGGIIFLNL